MPPRLQVNRNANYSPNSKTFPATDQDEPDLLSFDHELRPSSGQKQKSQRQLSEPPPPETTSDRVESDSDRDSAFGTPKRVRGEPEVDIQDVTPFAMEYGDKSRSPSTHPKLLPSKSTSGPRAQRPAAPPRFTPQTAETEDLSDPHGVATGHSRAPMPARESSPLESLTKAVRSYLPSTAPFSASPFGTTPAPNQHHFISRSQRSPTPSVSLRSGQLSRVAPAPPLVSRPVIPLSRSASSPMSSREEGLYNFGHPPNTLQDEHDPILWSRFDEIQDQKYLLLGYTSGIQIWHYSSQGKLNEVLNIPDVSILNGMQSGDEYVKYAAFMPYVSSEDAPLLGLVLSSILTIYSMNHSRVVKCMTEFPGADRFESNANYILLSTVNPVLLHIISSKTLQSLHTISSNSLLTAVSPPSLIVQPNPHDPSTTHSALTEHSAFGAYLAQQSPSHPVFALNGRLLAYLSPPPAPTPSGDKASKRWSSGAAGIGGKLGGAVLSGMRFALTAAAQAGSSGTGGRYFSKSAPTGESDSGNWPSSSPTSLSPLSPDRTSNEGQYVVIMDLVRMRKVSGFHVTSEITALSFSKDGTKIVAATRDGTIFTVFSLRCLQQPYHEYDLRRGRTPAVADHSSIEWTGDGLWLGVSTRNRTLHIFPINPYGGKVDAWSHLQDRVRDGTDIVHKGTPNTIQVYPLTRIRPANKASGEQFTAPLAFTFLTPKHGQPLMTLSSSSSQKGHPTKGSQRDVLVFDPTESTLSLHRFIVDRKPARSTGEVISASLPSAMLSNLSAMMEGSEQELNAKEATIASWSDVQRKKGWEECKWVSSKHNLRPTRTTDWLSQAELTTSQRQRSIYLSHQLSFHAFGEDYHALIRTRQFNIPATKITVQREVHPVSSSENLSAGQQGHQAPLNEALSIGMDHTPPVPTLPMYPNGTPRSWTRPSSMSLGSIPIKTVTEGVSGGLGRIRREISKARSPVRSAAKAEEGLEFDDQDDDFELGSTHIETSGNAVDEGEVFVLDHEPAPPPSLKEESQDWEPAEEAQRVVDEIERFDNISVVGFLEEEQEDRIRAEIEKRGTSEEGQPAMKKGRKKKGKKY